MKKVVILIICIVLMFNLSGCWSSHELNDYAFVMGVAMDKGTKNKNVLITAQIAKPSGLKADGSSSEGGSSSGDAYWNVKSEGESVFDTVREFTHESERKLYWNHNNVVIFGQSLAEEGIQDSFDFFMRGYEIRLASNVFVAKGIAGEAFYVNPKLGDMPANSINKLTKVQQFTSETYVVTLQQFACSLMSKTCAPVAPLIEVKGEGEEQQLLLSGTAVFKEDKLVGELNKTETRGLLWVVDEVESGIVVVDCPDVDGIVSIEIRNSSTSITPEIIDGNIKMNIEIKVEGNIGDQSCKQNLATSDMFKVLQGYLASAVKNEILSSLKVAKELNTDFYDFGGAVHRKYPGKWSELEGKWDDIFPDIEVGINVDAKLNSTGKIYNPANSEQE